MGDLTDRMRTCAAWIIEHDSRAGGPSKVLANVTLDAADLLIEASNLLEQAHLPLGEPMEIIPPIARETPDGMIGGPYPDAGAWIAAGDTLPAVKHGTVSPRACPHCDSRANKTVRREGAKLMLTCPVCGATWEYKR
jgi:hypothetical protein